MPQSSDVITKSGNLKYLEPSSLLRACNGTDLPLFYVAEFLKLETFLGKDVRKINTRVLCSILYITENRSVYEIRWKNILGRSRILVTKRRMRIACWIPKATNTNSQYVTFNTFTLNQWLNERASLLCYMYIEV